METNNKTTSMPKWLQRLNHKDRAGASKHARGKRKPRNWRKKRKAARRMSKLSRMKNR